MLQIAGAVAAYFVILVQLFTSFVTVDGVGPVSPWRLHHKTFVCNMNKKRTGHWETLFIHVNELTKILGICVYLRHDIGKCRWLYIHGTCCANNNIDLPLFLSFGVNTSDIYKHNTQSDDKCKNKSNVNRSYGRLLNAKD